MMSGVGVVNVIVGYYNGTSARPCQSHQQQQLIIGFPHRTPKTSTPGISSRTTTLASPYPFQTNSNSTNSRFQNAMTLKCQLRPRLYHVFASNSHPPTPGGDSIKEKSEAGSPLGPPLLTILAGFLVFFLICWVFGSILIWLFRLIVC